MTLYNGAYAAGIGFNSGHRVGATPLRYPFTPLLVVLLT